MNVTILTASTGNGHMSAAFALEAVFKERGANVHTHDALKFAPYAFRQWYGGGYEFIVRTKPSLYGHLYHISDERKMSYKIQTASDFIFLSKLRKLLAREKPDWVVCTHSLPQPRLAQLREEFGTFRMAVVVTDLYPHLMWLRGTPDHFFVPTDWTKQILIERRVQYKDRISVTGIPVHPVFSSTFSQEELKQALDWDGAMPCVTLTSGGIGGGPFSEALQALTASGIPMHLEVVCGRNEQRRKQIEKIAAECARPSQIVKVRGHIPQEEMAKRMAASSLFISKPGGLTTSECLATGTAMLVYEPFLIPGQEEGNADFLVTSGAGAKASGPTELASVVTALLAKPEAIQEMRRIAKSHGKPHAATDIVTAIEDLT